MSDCHDVADLKRIATIVAACQDKFHGLETVLGTLRSMLTCAAVGVWRFDDEMAYFELIGANPVDVTLPHRISQSDGIFDPEVWQNPSGEVRDCHQPVGAEPFGYTTMLLVPLVWQSKVVGGLGIFGDDDCAFDDERRHDLLTVVAPLLAARIVTEKTTSETLPALDEEHKRLLHIQVAIRRMLEQPDVSANVAESVKTIQTLGWRRVVLVLYTSDQHVEQIFSAGVLDEELPAYGDHLVPRGVWDRLLAGELEPLRRSGIYCLFGDGGVRAQWQAGDIVFGLLKAGQGDIIGLVRIDEPVDGRRPDNDALRAVDILANQTAYVIENAHMIERASQSAKALSDQVEVLSMMHRADRELSTHLDVDRITRLTMDWAMRRTGAAAGLMLLMDPARQGLTPVVALGQINHDLFPYDAQNPLPPDIGSLAQAVETKQTVFIHDAAQVTSEFPYFPSTHSLVIVPLAMYDEALGLVVLGTSHAEGFNQGDLHFLELLGRRAVVALDNARLFKQSEQLADDMAVIYTASRTITSTLERGDLLQRIAQVITVALECSSAVIFDYQREMERVQVLAVYRLGTAQDAAEILPEINEVCALERYPMLDRVVRQNRTIELYTNDLSLPKNARAALASDGIRAIVMVPLVAQNEMIGLAAVIEGRHDRRFSPDDVFRLKTLSSQAAVALRQAMLYNEVLELEKLKSEMIRMASHDLRNPLNNIMGYVDLIGMSLEQNGMTPELRRFIDNLKTSTRSMQSLLEDLLTLERIESDRQHDWRQFDFAGLVLEVADEEQAGAALKKHTLTLDRPTLPLPVYGSVRQMRQAVANMIGNAIKYTPENGRVEVCVQLMGSRVQFQVTDNGYGISPERQSKIFQRFYRAREPGTDHITGTGLGLSLVKTVIERHGGEVWFESEHGKGSTFGFWVPKDEGLGGVHNLRG